MKFCILVSAFCILTSVGLSQDISLDTILAPSGTIDSGQLVVPCAVITNHGNEPADGVNAYFTIDDGTPSWPDSITGMYLDMRTTETLSFTGRVMQGRDSMTAIAWIHYEGDTNPQNDTFRQRFFVRVRDIAVTQITMPPPDTTLDSGLVFFPRCRVWNFGNVSVTFDVRFTIGEYQSTCNVNLIPGGAKAVTAPTPYTAMPGIWSCRVFAVVTGDLHPENSIMVDTFTVRGTVLKDVEARAVLAPGSVVDTTMMVTPKGRYGNNGDDSATFWAFFIIQNFGGADVYAESTQVLLGSGDSTEVEYLPIKFSVLGNYTAACSVYMVGDQNSTNDVVRRPFRVVERVTGDVGFTQFVYMPRDTVDTLTTFGPGVKLKNYGAEGCSVCVFLVFSDTVHDQVVYRDSEFTGLPAGAEVQVDFDSVRFTVLGLHQGLCWFQFSYDRPDTVGWQFWVVPFVPGVEEAMNDERRMMNAATVLRRLPAGAVAFDATGRRVLNPKPGVYFVWEQSAFSSQHSGTENGAPSTVHVRKVILQR